MLPEDRARIAGSFLFLGIGLESVEGLLDACPVVDVPAGTVLLSPSHDNRAVSVVLEGEVEVHLDVPGPEPYVRLGPGHCVGEMSIIDGQRPSATVIASSPLRLLEIGEDVLWSLVNASHGVARNLLYVLSGRMRYENRALVEAQRTQEMLEQMATTDTLTGLHNRRWMQLTFPRQLERCTRAGQTVTVLLLDLDGFKPFNDRHGHLQGDAALRSTARVLASRMRPADLLARYGGEEFAILLPGADRAQGLEIAERLRAAVAHSSLEDDQGESLPSVTISIGVAQAVPGEALESVLDRSDRAMYRAKREGRNCVRG